MGTCYECRFYGGNMSMGDCRRYAPHPRPADKLYNICTTAWPTVRSNDWCGEFKPKDVTVSTTPETKQ